MSEIINCDICGRLAEPGDRGSVYFRNYSHFDMCGRCSKKVERFAKDLKRVLKRVEKVLKV